MAGSAGTWGVVRASGYGPAMAEAGLFDEPSPETSAEAGLFDEPPPEGSAGGARTWTVSELSAHIGRMVAGALPGDVWVEGQIRNLSRAANGHVYFQLVEPAEAGRAPRAQLAVTLLDAERHHVNEALRRAGGSVRMADGIEVRIAGRVRWYGPRGVLQVRMHAIDPAFTLGRLQADRDRILAGLAADGLLDANAALAFPLVPLRVGLVTSRSSAAHADVIAELAASGFGFTVASVDARTQGLDCGPSVARALAVLASQDVDVVLVVRGGGARTDLAGFDTDQIARAIAAMAVPVLTGIGHEVDRSIADEVAHRAHKTPTAAAAEVVRAVAGYLERVERCASGVRRAGQAATADAVDVVGQRRRRLGRAAAGRLDRHQDRLGVVAAQVARQGARTAVRAERQLGERADALAAGSRRQLVQANRQVDAVASQVRAHDPALALARGWSITVTADGRLVRSVADVAPGTTIETRLADGSVTSTVEHAVAAGPADHLNEEPEP